MSTGASDVSHLRPLSSKVEALAGFGLSAADIALVLATEEAALREEYAAELDGGQIKANARVAESLFRKATGEGRESVTAAIFWLKTRARWKETQVSEVSHSVAEPMSAFMERIAIQGRRIHDP
jgi:hypothetical protein